MKKVTFTVDGIQGWQRPGARVIGRHAQIYTPPKTKAFEEKIAEAYRAAGGEKFDIDVPVRISVVIFHGVPKSTSKKKREEMLKQFTRPIRKPDGDNVLKCIMDGLNQVAYHDDRQVVSISVYKYWAEEDYLEIRVKEASI